MTASVAVVAAHPDDEVLGCGGVMARHAQDGDDVHVLIVAEGITSRNDDRGLGHQGDALSALAEAAHAANRQLGARSVTLLGYPDNRLDSVDLLDLAKAIEAFFRQRAPEVVYTHHGSDLNVDHSRVHQAVVTASRPYPDQAVRRLLFFEVPSSTEWQVPITVDAFRPNYFVEIAGTLDRKLAALACYESEMRPWPHARSLRAVEALARWRGANVGVEAAEAFSLGRQILR